MELDEEFADPASAQRLRDAYTGRHEVTDAIWWRSHPLDQGPSGAASPAAEAARLARLVFSRDGADSATVVAHAAAESQLEADRRDIDEAIARAREAVPSAVPNSAQPPAPTDELEGAERESEADEREHIRGRSSVRRLALVAAAAVVLAAVAGVWVGMRIPIATPEQATDVGAFGYDPFAPKDLLSSGGATASGTSTATPIVSPAPALAVFDRAQVRDGNESDVPPLSLKTLVNAGYQTSSFRRIESIYTFPTGADSSLDPEAGDPVAVVYAARNLVDGVCVIAVRKEHITASACAIETEFPVSGLQLSFTVGLTLYSVTWSQTGSPGYSSTPG